jgi:Polyketide cyclase / dehydrase and lipid transport
VFIIAGPKPNNPRATKVAVAILSIWCIGEASNAISPASSAELTRSTDVAATPSAVWSTIGPFCAIKDWHPVVGTCSEDGRVPPTRTLVTKDGKVTFVETQVARNDAERTYSYNFVSSPFPVTKYIGTIKVSAKGPGRSTITWHGTYVPLPGKEKDADAAFAGVYEAGLAALKSRFGG